MPTIYVHTVQIISLTCLRLAEEAVFGSCEFRPKSAPPATSSPATDIRYGYVRYSTWYYFTILKNECVIRIEPWHEIFNNLTF